MMRWFHVSKHRSTTDDSFISLFIHRSRHSLLVPPVSPCVSWTNTNTPLPPFAHGVGSLLPFHHLQKYAPHLTHTLFPVYSFPSKSQATMNEHQSPQKLVLTPSCVPALCPGKAWWQDALRATSRSSPAYRGQTFPGKTRLQAGFRNTAPETAFGADATAPPPPRQDVGLPATGRHLA